MIDTNSKYLNIQKLRSHRAPVGQSARVIFKLSLSPETQRKLEELAPLGKGKYGSAIVDIAIDLLYELVTEGNDLDLVAIRINEVVTANYITRNLERLLRILSV